MFIVQVTTVWVLMTVYWPTPIRLGAREAVGSLYPSLCLGPSLKQYSLGLSMREKIGGGK